MGKYENKFASARSSFDKQIETIRDALLKILEDEEAAQHGDEEYEVTADEELQDFDELWDDINTAADKLQDEIDRLES